MTEEELLPFCECGKCGLRVTKRGNRFVHGHNMQGKHHTQKSKEKMSKTKTGIPKPPRSPEHCAAMSAAQKDVPHTSEAQIAADEAKRGVPYSPERCAAISKGCEKMLGGNDIVNRHYIYDHSDLTKYTMKMTRSRHQRLHRLMQKSGIKVPHINVKEVK